MGNHLEIKQATLLLLTLYRGKKKAKSISPNSPKSNLFIVLHFAISIRFLKANYLTFDLILSRNAGDFSGSVDGRVDFFEYLSVKQFSVFQGFAK